MKRNFVTNIVLIGMPGSGKTTIGKNLAQKLNRQFFDGDIYLENTTGQSIAQIFAQGEKHFRRLEKTAIKALSKKCNTVIATGGGVVLDKENIKELKTKGIVFFIDRPLQNIRADLEKTNRPLLVADKNRIYQIFQERHNLYKEYADYKILNNHTIRHARDKIINILKGLMTNEDTYY